MTLYAKWGHEVIFVDGDEVMKEMIVESNTAIPSYNVTKDGFTFMGWYKEEECINRWNFFTGRVTDNMFLFALWEEEAVFDLAGYKAGKIASLDSKYPESKFPEEFWEEISEAINMTKQGINAAADKSEVDFIYDTVTSALDELLEQIEYIDALKAELLTEFGKYKKSDYTDENWTKLVKFKDDGIAAIDLAEDMNEADKALLTAINGMKEVGKKNGEDNGGGCGGNINTNAAAGLMLLVGAAFVFKRTTNN